MARSRPDQPLDKQVARFVQFHFADKSAFAPFTGTDYDAWRAYIHLVRLWGRTRNASVVAALRAVVYTAQFRHEDVMAIFKKSIPCLLDWSDERKLWMEICPAEMIHVCSDGPRICSHVHSKPSKKRSGWFVCKDPTCRDEWRPADDDRQETLP